MVFPEPVSPATTTTWWSRIAAAMSSRRADTGRSAGKWMRTAPPLSPARVTPVQRVAPRDVSAGGRRGRRRRGGAGPLAVGLQRSVRPARLHALVPLALAGTVGVVEVPLLALSGDPGRTAAGPAACPVRPASGRTRVRGAGPGGRRRWRWRLPRARRGAPRPARRRSPRAATRNGRATTLRFGRVPPAGGCVRRQHRVLAVRSRVLATWLRLDRRSLASPRVVLGHAPWCATFLCLSCDCTDSILQGIRPLDTPYRRVLVPWSIENLPFTGNTQRPHGLVTHSAATVGA